MTSWRIHLFLYVLLSRINLSKEACFDYFNVDNWATNLSDTISLVNTKDSRDIMECTVERECLNGRNICHILYHCFLRQEDLSTISAKCDGNTFQAVSFYHFMCLIASATNQTVKGCEYDTPCKFLSVETASASTLPTPTTMLPKRTTTMSTTTTKTTTQPEKIAPTRVSQINGHMPQMKTNSEILTLKTLLAISMIANLAVPFIVYMVMRRQRRHEYGQSTQFPLMDARNSEIN